MRRFRLLATSLLVALCTGFSSCGDDVTNEIIQEVQEPDNTLELLIGTWEGTGEVAGRLFKFNEDYTYSYDTPYSNETENGTFEYFPYRYMFVTFYTTSWGEENTEENTIYTVVKVTEDELYLNDNGHSDIIIYKRK